MDSNIGSQTGQTGFFQPLYKNKLLGFRNILHFPIFNLNTDVLCRGLRGLGKIGSV